MVAIRESEVDTAQRSRTYAIHLVGGGQISLDLRAVDLDDVAHILSTQRHLIGRSVPNTSFEDSYLALVPSNRVQLVVDADA